MLDTTSYTDKLTTGLNEMLKSFTGSECIMVRKIKEKDSLKGKSGNCHINVKKYIDKNPYGEIAWHQKGRLYYGLKDYKNAVRSFEFATYIDDEFIGSYLILAHVRVSFGISIQIQ